MMGATARVEGAQRAVALAIGIGTAPGEGPAVGETAAPNALAGVPVAAPGADAALPQWLAVIAARAQDRPGGASAAEVAFGHLYDATLSRVYAVTRRICQDPALAEEVTEDVYVQVWREAARFDPARGAPLAWLLVLARSRSLDALRRRDPAVAVAEPELLADEQHALTGEVHDDPLSLLAALERESAARAALAALPARERQMVALAFLRGFTHAEIAEQTGLPLGTVKTTIRRALAAMKEMLETPVSPAAQRVATPGGPAARSRAREDGHDA
jgi:RNA polymerase sigma factor (sigma-70 family)